MKKIEINSRVIIKAVITLFYLLSSIWSTYLIFSFMLTNNINNVGQPVENIALVLLYSVGLSALTIFMLGLLSIFTHFVYVKLIYGNEIRNAAYVLLKNKRMDKNRNKNVSIMDEVNKEANKITKEKTQINS